jgi:hypothetical protein
MKCLFTIILLSLSLQWVNSAELTFYYRDGSFEIKRFDDNTEKLEFTYGAGRNIVEIVGLEQFAHLKELWLGMTKFINDYHFLSDLDTLEVLVFQDIKFSSIDFLYGIGSLKRLIFQSCEVSQKIDASRIPNLEYFEFTNSKLTDFPITIQNTRKIDTINIAYNNIGNIPINNRINILIIAVGNPIQETRNKKIITGSPEDSIYHLLPERYRQYVR